MPRLQFIDNWIIRFKEYTASLNLVEKENITNLDYIFKLIDFIENPPNIKPLILKEFLADYQIKKVAESYEGLFKAK